MTQEEALAILKTGVNAFLTGEPGSGKTHLVNRYVRYLREHNVGVAVTASTGIAATHLDGMTIHSWSGIGINKQLSKADLQKLKETRRLTSRAQRTSVLIIDEISMLDAMLLDTVNTALKALRENTLPFGGLQVIFVGDFFQLPPVVTKEEYFSGFAFASSAWTEAKPVTCYLSDQFRHEDIKFLKVLTAIRNNENLEEVFSFLSSRKVIYMSNEFSTRLYSHNVDVNRINNEKLEGLPGIEYIFEMTSRGAKPLIEQLKKSCLSPEILTLKLNAKVMFTKNNFEEGYVNGTLGEVVGFEDDKPIVRTKGGQDILTEPVEWEINDGLKVLASITQIPLRLAWAITIHKSQGMTLDEAVIDLSYAFEYGQGYVALSRVKTLSGLFLLGLNRKALEVHPDIVQEDVNFRLLSKKAENILHQYTEHEIKEKHDLFITNNGGSLKKVADKTKASTYDQTLTLYKDGKNIAAIASIRGLKERTIISHLEKLKARGRIKIDDLVRIVPENLKGELPQIHRVFYNLKTTKLLPVFEKFGGKYSYDELSIARLLLEDTVIETV